MIDWPTLIRKNIVFWFFVVELNQGYPAFPKIVGVDLRIPHAAKRGAEDSLERNIKAFQVNQRKMEWILRDKI